MKARLNKRTVDAAKYEGNGKGACYVWDTEAAGFALRIYPSGRKSFVVTYRFKGIQRFHTLGRFGEMTVEEARAAAYDCRGRVRRGEDPGGLRRAERDAPTIADLAERYWKEHASVKKKPKSARQDQLIWKNHILPRLAKRKVVDIARGDIASLHAEMASTPTQANMVRTILSKAFNLAELWGWRAEGSNPCRGVASYKTNRRERYLSESELARLGEVLAEAERTWESSPYAIAAIRLLLLTGCRSIEILTLEWKYVDLERQCLHLPDSKTGAKTVRLNSAAVQVLKGIERIEDNPYVIPGEKPGTHRASLYTVWLRICREASLEELNIHDMRHTFASFGVNAGLNLPVIGKLLGHSKVTTTERYAHLADAAIRDANEMIGRTLEAKLAGAKESQTTDPPSTKP